MDSLEHIGVMDDRRDYRDDLLHVSASLLTAGLHATDKEIDAAVSMADRLIRRVDRFVLRPAAQPLPLSEIDAGE
jgi:hypothetical protein